MKSLTAAKQPLILILAALVICVSYSFLPKGVNLFGYELKYVDMLSDIRTPADAPTSIVLNQSTASKAAIFGAESFSRFFNNLVNRNNENTPPLLLAGNLTGNTAQLSYFFDALKNAKTKGVRIAHFGDSGIEGDLISAEIREGLQSKFGGSTVGHLGIVSQDINFRSTTKHSYSQSNTWEVASLYGSNPKNIPLGISGEVAIPKGGAWVRYELAKVQRSLKDFSSIRIFYTNAKASAIKVYFNDAAAAKSINLTAGSGLKELVVKSDAPAKSVKIEFPDKDQAHFYGVSLEGEQGVYVDNFPLRGNTGSDIQKISESMMKEYAKYLDYKLIVLEFGLNIAGSQDYSWYEREMGKVISLFKTAFPKAGIILVSVHDKNVKQGSNFITDPTIPKLLAAQKNIAEKNGVAFYNLFEAMGGVNSMVKWVTANPPLATRDYSHFNIQGAKKLADMFVQSLLDISNKKK